MTRLYRKRGSCKCCGAVYPAAHHPYCARRHSDVYETRRRDEAKGKTK